MNQRLQKQRETEKFYNKLTPAAGAYCYGHLSSIEIMWIMKARCDMLGLNVNKFEPNADKRCSLCSEKVENGLHFIGKYRKITDYLL